jgi:hypothetical protein
VNLIGVLLKETPKADWELVYWVSTAKTKTEDEAWEKAKLSGLGLLNSEKISHQGCQVALIAESDYEAGRLNARRPVKEAK